MNLDIDLEHLINESDKKLEVAYETKLMTIFKIKFPSIINIVCKSIKTDMIV